MKRSRPAIERFNKRIEFNGPQSPYAEGQCHLWTGYIGRDGYGQLHANGRHVRAHRFAWMLHRGAIPEGKFVCHHCDEPACVRIEHLFISDNKGNMQDARAKRRTWQWPGALNSRWNFRVRNADIERLYRDEFASCNKIARQTGLDRATIYRRLKSLGIPLRTRSEAAQLARARKLSLAA